MIPGPIALACSTEGTPRFLERQGNVGTETEAWCVDQRQERTHPLLVCPQLDEFLTSRILSGVAQTGGRVLEGLFQHTGSTSDKRRRKT